MFFATVLIGTMLVFAGIGLVYYISLKNPKKIEYIWVGNGKNPLKDMR
ncbi:hypothetical protein JXB31_00960 [Candidatus Woesearchaeota archaeon]|nr:hypothetical protein [Candidatus Woesearchaeota archaeon]